MEVDDIQSPTGTQPPACKFSRVGNGTKIDSTKIGGSGSNNHIKAATESEPEHEPEPRRVDPTTTTTGGATTAVVVNNNNGSGSEMVVGANNRFRQWQHSSRIIRVSRASGGKDRHSKVWTAKGPRDRRVRLSVTTAIQFYDLQDRLGYDQPSKAVEWLIKAASEAINELPSLSGNNFPPDTPRQASEEGRGGVGNVVDSVDGVDVELDGDPGFGQNNQQMGSMSMSKSGCSSNNSETSKGSGGLSLSRSEIRVKARERARERTAKEKEREMEPTNATTRVNVSHPQQNQQQHQQNVSNIPQTSSFTQLLTAGINNLNESNTANSSSPRANHHQWLSSAANINSTAPMDYFGANAGLRGTHTHSTSGYSAGLIQLGTANSLPQVMTISPAFTHNSQELNHHHHHHHHHQHFPFLSDQQHHLIQQVPNTGGSGGNNHEYNLNFSISSSSTNSGHHHHHQQLQLGGNGGAFNESTNRGTLQSNSSPSLLPYLQRFSATTDGSSVPFFLGGTAVENHQQHQHQHQQFHPSAGLQLCYGDGNRQSDQKGKGKN